MHFAGHHKYGSILRTLIFQNRGVVLEKINYALLRLKKKEGGNDIIWFPTARSETMKDLTKWHIITPH